MVRRAWCVAAAAAVLVAAGACKKSGPGGQGGFGGGGPMGLPVEVAVARTDTVRDEIAATGQIEAVQSIDLRPEVEGRIVEFLVREGQEVDKDTPLFKVDDAQLQAQVAQLAAQRDLAQQALARTKGLVQQNASSAADWSAPRRRPAARRPSTTCSASASIEPPCGPRSPVWWGNATSALAITSLPARGSRRSTR